MVLHPGAFFPTFREVLCFEQAKDQFDFLNKKFIQNKQFNKTDKKICQFCQYNKTKFWSEMNSFLCPEIIFLKFFTIC